MTVEPATTIEKAVEIKLKEQDPQASNSRYKWKLL